MVSVIFPPVCCCNRAGAATSTLKPTPSMASSAVASAVRPSTAWARCRGSISRAAPSRPRWSMCWAATSAPTTCKAARYRPSAARCLMRPSCSTPPACRWHARAPDVAAPLVPSLVADRTGLGSGLVPLARRRARRSQPVGRGRPGPHPGRLRAARRARRHCAVAAARGPPARDPCPRDRRLWPVSRPRRRGAGRPGAG